MGSSPITLQQEHEPIEVPITQMPASPNVMMPGPQYTNPYLNSPTKTPDERRKTKAQILDKHKKMILMPSELDNYVSAKSKVNFCKTFSNVIMLTALLKFFTLRNSNPHLRRLTLFKLLLMNGVTIGLEIYFMGPVRTLRKEYEHKYLDHLSDSQLD